MTFNREFVHILCPFGNWPHPRGMQIVDESSAEKMRRNSEAAFSRKIPIYMGHPDDKCTRHKVPPVGYVQKICLTDGGIAVVSRYCESAAEKIRGGQIKAMSPRWQMEPLSDGSYRPVKLISVGLTNNPNIPDSGKIISVSAKNETLKSARKLAREIFEQCGKFERTLGKCAKRAEDIGSTIKSAAVAERLHKAGKIKSAGEKKTETPRLRDIPALALERSKKLGEPYIKCFAALRKEMGACANKQ